MAKAKKSHAEHDVHDTLLPEMFIHPVPGIALGPGDKMVNKPSLVAPLVEHSV